MKISFTGIDEAALGPEEVENYEFTLRRFMAEHMHITDNIQIDRVHILGRYKRQQRYPRPIIVKFHRYKAKEMDKQRLLQY